MVICTIAAANYLSKAAYLERSLRQTQPSHEFVLCLVERDRTCLRHLSHDFSRVVLASELEIPNFESFMFRYDKFEACSAVKADLLLWSLKNYPSEDFFVYLDPDVMPISRFEELEDLNPSADIVMTPHLVHDEETADGIGDNMFRALTTGTFNMGFLAIRRSANALSFLRWWSRKLQEMCWTDLASGLFGDQKWALFAMSFFEVKVLREPGYNVANWNISKRNVTQSIGSPGLYSVNGKPLRFIHFSGMYSGRDMYFFEKHREQAALVIELRSKYLEETNAIGSDFATDLKWTYEHFHSGEAISRELRLFYRQNQRLIERIRDPFALSSAQMFSGAFPQSKAEPAAQSRFKNMWGRLKAAAEAYDATRAALARKDAS